MSKIDKEFQNICNTILNEGREYENKNRGVKRLQIPSYTFKHAFKDGFPAITNKKLYWEGIVAELIWFLRGDNDVTYLNDNKVDIWNKDAYNWYKKELSTILTEDGEANMVDNGDGTFRLFTFEEFTKRGVGSVGQNYSKQWRAFNGEVDQITDLIKGMKKDIMSSRLKVEAWNPSEINKTALPPCHTGFQIVGVPLTTQERLDITNDRVGLRRATSVDFPSEAWQALPAKLDADGVPEFGFELHWNQRSVDTFLGLPFNIASYGLLAKILEELTGYPALGIEGTLKCVHFYDNQYDAVNELLTRDPDTHPNCSITMSEEVKFAMQALNTVGITSKHMDEVLEEMEPQDFKLTGYSSDKAIKVEMLAPKEI